MPIGRCPLDHLLNPAELKPSAEEWVRECARVVLPLPPTLTLTLTLSLTLTLTLTLPQP